MFDDESQTVTVAKVLLEKYQWNVDTKNKYGSTPLIHAAYNYPRLAELLIQRGAQINHQNHHKWSALHMAAANNSKQAVKVLLLNGADVALKDSGDRTALQLARNYKNHEIVSILKQFELRDMKHLATVLGINSKNTQPIVSKENRSGDIGLLKMNKSVLVNIFSFLKPK